MSWKPESTEYFTGSLVEVTPETQDSSTYVFRVESEEPFSFIPGQFNMIGFPGFEEAPISMSSLPRPESALVSHTVRRVGNVTKRIGRMLPGESIMMRGPFGRGWPLEALKGRNVLVVAGGIGLAPLRPLLHHCFRHRAAIEELALVYGARTRHDMFFRQELLDWQQSDSLETILCVDGLEVSESEVIQIREGLVTEHLEDLDWDPRRSVACVCGPEIMMRFVAKALMREGYRSRDIYLLLERRMRCGTAHCGHCQIGSKFVCKDGPLFSYAEIAGFADTLL